MIWKPNVTVAAVLEQDGRFLLVEENTPDGVRFNQPAGHLEKGEALIDAAVREALEETAYHFKPTALIGVYRWPHPTRDITYLRFAFTGEILGHEPDRALDDGIIRAAWLTPEEIFANEQAGKNRSPLIRRCVEDCLAGRRYPLDLLTDYPG